MFASQSTAMSPPELPQADLAGKEYERDYRDYHLCSVLGHKNIVGSVPATPQTPPTSPPSYAGIASDFTEVLNLASNSRTNTLSSPYTWSTGNETLSQTSVATLLPSIFAGHKYGDGSDSSTESEYSDRSIESTRNSSTFSIGSLSIPPLPKTQCALCKDSNMIQLNGSELLCGHFAHRCCLRDKIRAWSGVVPPCQLCGQDCVEKAALLPQADLSGSGKPQTSEVLKNGIIERENPKMTDPMTTNLKLETTVQSQTASTHEVLFKVTAPLSNPDYWRYTHTPEDEIAARRCRSNALGVASMNGSRMNADKAGRFRLVSKLKDSRTDEALTGYLFDHAVFLTQLSKDGFEELVHSFDLSRPDVEITGVASMLYFSVGNAVIKYKAASPTIVASWVAATRDLALHFPIAYSDKLEKKYYAPRCLLHLIICLPFEHLKAVPYVLSRLGPLDKLGLVVTVPGGSCAWSTPQKPGWVGWEVIAKDYTNSFGLFTPASQPILQTAEWLLGTPVTGIQKSVILVAGSPLATATIGRPVHVVGVGDYDLELLSNTAIRSDGDFYHARSEHELATVLAGIAAAERTYTHHEVQLSVVAGEGVRITNVVGHDGRKVKRTSANVEIKLGSIMAGQTRTVLLEVSGAPKNMQSAVITDCQVSAASAVSDRTEWKTHTIMPNTAAHLEIFFERMVRLAANIFSQGVELVQNSQLQEINVLVSRAVVAIERAAAGLRTSRVLSVPTSSAGDGSASPARLLMSAHAEMLANGLEELRRECVVEHANRTAAGGLLLQASLVLGRQRAVTHRTLLEHIYFEQLEINQL